jgi:nucleobase:cation symporter-1, NCS1 family
MTIEAGDLLDPTRVKPAIEFRSVGWIPPEERFGRARGLAPMWFVSNINLTTLATGVAAFSVGAGLVWTVVATIIGSLFGTIFAAAHSSQGPHTGLPQLVQSRPQFGYLGAAVTVWIFALVNYVTYNVSDAILASASLESVFGLPIWAGYLVIGAASTVIAVFGYRLIHWTNRLLSIPILIVMIALTAVALTRPEVVGMLSSAGEFKLAPFMTVFLLTAGYQLGWGPYVSDYSRYLPTSTRPSSAFWWTFVPCLVAGAWVFILGALVSAFAPGMDPVAAVLALSNSWFPGFGGIAISLLVLGLLSAMVVNQYGGSLAIVSIIDSFRTVKPGRAIRVGAVLGMFVVVWGLSQLIGPEQFNLVYSNAVIFLAYLFIPWSAINLADYLFVRRGVYVVSEMFNPAGIYGRWGVRGISAYVIAVVAEIPFMVTAPWTGWAARALGGVDYSIFVGLAVGAVTYILFCRNLDLDREKELAELEGRIPTRL